MKTMKLKRVVLMLTLLVMSISAVTGGTIAWFTDSVTSANNVIEAGNLDIEVYVNEVAAANKIGTKPIFTMPELWEPGAVATAKLILKNEGNLALKYEMTLSTVAENDLDGHKLSEVLKVAFVTADLTDKTREEVVAAAQAAAPSSFSAFKLADSLEKGQSDTGTLVAYWLPGINDNDYNANNGQKTSDDKPLSITLGVNVQATQLVKEEDAFGPEYDEAAYWADTSWYTMNPTATAYTLNTMNELAGLAQIVNGTGDVQDTFAGKTIKLGADINLNGMSWTPIGRVPNANSTTDFTYAFKGTFDGQNHTVSNLNVSNEGWAGLFGLAYKAEFKNVKIVNATLDSSRMSGALVGQLYGSIDNCHVEDVEITVVPNMTSKGYDNGDKVGGIVGWLGDNGNNRTLTNCSAKDVEIKAYRDMGGIAGYVASSTQVKNNTVTEAKLYIDQDTNYYGAKDYNAGLVFGRKGGDIVEDNNTATGSVILWKIPDAYTGETFTVSEGVTAIGNYAFTYNRNVKTVILPSTVRDLGRGFDTSTVEKVVLKEGLETISSRAFKATSNLKEVVISSTVKTIADDAFQKTGLKTITIPANVKYVGAQAFGASLIEEVIFEGDIEIQNKAFRGCGALRKVYLNGDDVTFTNTTGEANCWFCNSESNNPNASNITFYVKNKDVAQKVKTMMGAEANNTPVYVNDTLYQ